MRLRRAAAACAALGLALGCGGKAYVREGFLDHPPKRVAILPFVITYAYDRPAQEGVPSDHQVGRDTFRKTFAQGFSTLGYEDLKLAEVDARLAQSWGPLEEERWRQASPQELGKALGVDAVISTELQRVLHLNTPLYTETSLIASLQMADTASGEVLWRTRVKAAERGGALVKKGQVVDFVKDQVRSYLPPEVKFLRVAETATRQALEGFPNPPMSLPAARAPAKGADVPRLAVLPFDAERPAWLKDAAVVLRRDLAAGLQEGRFDIVELGQVDAVLKAQGWAEGQPLPQALSPAKLAKDVRADLLLRGTVTRWGRTYLLIHSSVKAGLALELVEPASGEVVWTIERKNSRIAGVLKGPTGYKSIVTSPITGMKRSNLERVAGHLAQRMARELNESLAVAAYLGEGHAAEP